MNGSPALATQVLGTARLRLDPLAVDDAEEMAGVLADPSLYTFTGGEPPTLEALRKRYEMQVAGGPPLGDERWHNWIVRLRDEGTAIGYVQATVTRGGADADLGWVIGRPWQGQGYATEAANAVLHQLIAEGVRVVTAHIHADHAASAGVARRIGLLATAEVADGERAWRLDLGARERAKRRRITRLNIAVGVSLIGFAAFELVMARSGQLPRSGDQLARDLLLAGAGIAMLGYGLLAWWRARREA